MLQELDITNYAVAEKLRIPFHRGLNLLTGETGSGKSIIVDALSLLLGARATPDVIRAGSPKARVAGVFELTPSREGLRRLEASGLALEQGELIVEREVYATGKSRAYVNGRAVTLSFLRELASELGDIHGQHEQQDLFSARTQLDMLDAYAGVGEEVARLGDLYRQWRECGRRIEELRGNEQERLRLLDLYSFQHQEIEQAKIEEGEDERLEQERDVLENLTRIEEAAAAAYDALYDSSASAAAQIKIAGRALEEMVRFAPDLAALTESLESSRAQIEDAAYEIRAYLDRLEADPQRLTAIEDRLALLDKLKRKYGASLAEVAAYGEVAGRKLEELRASDRTIAEVEKEEAAAAREYDQLAQSRSFRRGKAARQLEGKVAKELGTLAMPKARFRIRFQPAASGSKGWTATGIDRVEFLVSANPGQPPRPLTQVASGGELSRITLALKTCLLPSSRARAADIPRTLVFDEIDTGVGGRVAEAVGRRLKDLAASQQVLCVTHLPQIAGFADAHYLVDKKEERGQTVASVVELAASERVDELARMLSGAKVTTAAVEHARQILKANRAAAG